MEGVPQKVLPHPATSPGAAQTPYSVIQDVDASEQSGPANSQSSGFHQRQRDLIPGSGSFLRSQAEGEQRFGMTNRIPEYSF